MRNLCYCLKENSEILEELWFIDWDGWLWFLKFGHVEPIHELYSLLLSLCPLRRSRRSLKYEWMVMTKFRGQRWRTHGSFQEFVEERACPVFLKSTPLALSLLPSLHLKLQMQKVSNDDAEVFWGITSFQWPMRLKEKSWNHSQLAPLAKLVTTSTTWVNDFN